ncbi:MAG: hypothetical protein [Cressdnaviricota sp.]|nr:MAG: hypothetical protein [Cressdnaviricota sp.]
MVDGRGCEWMERTYRPLFLSLLNLPPTTTMENTTVQELKGQSVKRSLEPALEQESKRSRADKVAQLEHCMMNFYREDHERQVDLKEQWAKRSNVLEERATRLHRHGIQMANSLETQATVIQQQRTELERMDRQYFSKQIQHYHLTRAIERVIEGKDDAGNKFEDKDQIVNYLRWKLNDEDMGHIIDNEDTISDPGLSEQEIQEVIDLTADEDIEQGYESDTEEIPNRMVEAMSMGINNGIEAIRLEDGSTLLRRVDDRQWPRGNI